ncbi:hypothetical protein [Pseudonocardia sp. HH130630-07]|uniref:hypothetical protein n=1 Tax=Pseudonocardia sp. HH130630-07 TaxID=1690815 RepID=UPI0012EA4575|nr:hypothetical protein [Pseudonocardia sp. HH130630-07]
MTRLAGAVVGMAAVALVLAYLVFGWPVLVVGGPLLVGVAVTVLVLVLTERPRALLRQRRSAETVVSPWRSAAERAGRAERGAVLHAPADAGVGGLMSGFFEVSPQPSVLPEQRSAPLPDARPASARQR